MHRGRHGQDRAGSEGDERTRGAAAGSDEPQLPLQADWIGSRATIAVAFQRSRRSRLARDLRRDAAHEGGIEGADQQDGSNDARGMAQMMRVGLYRPVHVKTLRSQKLRMLLTHRKLLQSKAIAIGDRRKLESPPGGGMMSLTGRWMK